MSLGFNLEPGDRVLIDGAEYFMHRMVPPLCEGDPDYIQFENRSGRIFTYSESEFLDLYNARKFRRLTRTERISDHAPEEEGAAARARRRLHYTKAFDADPVSKSEKPLRRFIEEVAAEIGDTHPPSTGSLRRWLRDRGEPDLRKLREMTERYRSGAGRQLHPFVEESLKSQMERYWDSRRVTAKEIWVRVINAITEKNGELPLSAKHLIPNIAYSTVWRRCQRDMTYERARRRYGPKLAARKFKAISGSLQADRLHDLAIMDHTDVDCWVIDDVTLQPIGRPRITFLIDSCSRYPLGFHVGWKSASVEAAMACLRHALPKKAGLREKYPEIQHEWLAYGQPREILVDQGLEFVGTSFEDTCADLGMSLRIAPVRTPEFKGQIERFIGTFNTELAHRLPGSVPGKPKELQALGMDPEKDAFLLLSELELLINKWVVDVYAREPHRELGASPAQVWERRLKTDPIELCPDLASLAAACSKVVKRVLTRAGIELNGLTYRSPAVSDLLGDLLPRSRKRNASAHGPEVKVKYHPEDLGSVYVWNEATGEYVELPCTKLEYARGLSEHLHRSLREWATQTNRAFCSEAEMCRARVDLYDLMDGMKMERVRERKRLQRLRHPERQLVADRVRLSTVDRSESDEPGEVEAFEVLIDPLRNRANGDELHPRRVLKSKGVRRASVERKRADRPPASVADAREARPTLLDAVDFAEEVAAARAQAERGQ